MSEPATNLRQALRISRAIRECESHTATEDLREPVAEPGWGRQVEQQSECPLRGCLVDRGDLGL